jgi:BolA protein
VKARIEKQAQGGLRTDALEVEDQTNQHHGHAGWRESGETHFRVAIRSAQFSGRSRVERQRAIYQVLSEELAGPVHALAISASAPGDAEHGPIPESGHALIFGQCFLTY